MAEPVEVERREVDPVGPDRLDVAAEGLLDPAGRRDAEAAWSCSSRTRRGRPRPPGNASGAKRPSRRAASAIGHSRPQKSWPSRNTGFSTLAGKGTLSSRQSSTVASWTTTTLSEPVDDRQRACARTRLVPRARSRLDCEPFLPPDPVVAKPEQGRRDVLGRDQEGIPGRRPKPVPGDLEQEHERLRAQRIRSPRQLVRQDGRSGLRKRRDNVPFSSAAVAARGLAALAPASD